MPEQATKTEDRRAAELAALREAARQVAAQLPALTPEQRLRVRAILHGR